MCGLNFRRPSILYLVLSKFVITSTVEGRESLILEAIFEYELYSFKTIIEHGVHKIDEIGPRRSIRKERRILKKYK